MIDTELAYLAGLFDGEGCIQIYKKIPNHGRTNKSPTFQLTVGIRNTDTKVMKWLHGKCSGCLHDQKASGSSKARSWYWSLSTREAANFLRSVQPYLIVKAEECEIALEFYAHVEEYKHNKYVNDKRGRPLLTNDILRLREEFSMRLKHVRFLRKRFS